MIIFVACLGLIGIQQYFYKYIIVMYASFSVMYNSVVSHMTYKNCSRGQFNTIATINGNMFIQLQDSIYMWREVFKLNSRLHCTHSPTLINWQQLHIWRGLVCVVIMLLVTLSTFCCSPYYWIISSIVVVFRVRHLL